MQLRLVILEGIRKDDEFTVKGPVVIGRTGVDLSLKDPKTSSSHAKITRNINENTFEIEDLGSLNGTYVNGHKIEAPIILKRGDKILIGKTLIEVLNIHNDSSFEEGSWPHIIEQTINEALRYYEKLPNIKSNFLPFEKPLTLEVISGGCAGASYLFAYGPRFFNKDQFEYDGTQEFPFELHTNEQKQPLLVSKLNGLLVNDVEVEKIILKDQDKISIGQLQLLVKF